jgi:long-chain acyl-CoA synthetase
MLVHRLLEDSAGREPDAIALIDGKRRVTYAELDQLANRFANLFRGAGVARHDRVVIALENSIEMVAAYLGTMKAGAVAVPLPAGPRSDRLAAAVQSCAPIAAVVDASVLAEDGQGRAPRDAPHGAPDRTPHRAMAGVNRVFVTGRLKPGTELPPSFTLLAPALAAAPAAPADARPIDVDLAAIIYTSGSTGEPRGVMLTHRNFTINAASIVSYLGLRSGDRVMCVLPFYYVYGLSLLHTHLAVGGSVVIDNRFVFPNVVLRAMQEHEVTGFAGVPSTFALLLHRSDIETWTCPSLRYVTQAGGAMSSSKIQEWRARGPKVPFFVMYGATEAAARLTYLEPERLADKPGSIGKAIPNVEVRVVKEDGTAAAAHEVGELVARGANISLGYWNDPIETARRFDRFGYRTGDLGYADDDGYLFIVGRRHDMLKLGAHRVGAREIEDVLQDFPAVLEAAVVGAPHDLLGEVAVAFVSLRDGFTAAADTLEAFCRTRLASYKIPAQFVVLPELPKLGAVGKVDKATLREHARSLVGAPSQPA